MHDVRWATRVSQLESNLALRNCNKYEEVADVIHLRMRMYSPRQLLVSAWSIQCRLCVPVPEKCESALPLIAR